MQALKRPVQPWDANIHGIYQSHRRAWLFNIITDLATWSHSHRPSSHCTQHCPDTICFSVLVRCGWVIYWLEKFPSTSQTIARTQRAICAPTSLLLIWCVLCRSWSSLLLLLWVCAPSSWTFTLLLPEGRDLNKRRLVFDRRFFFKTINGSFLQEIASRFCELLNRGITLCTWAHLVLNPHLQVYSVARAMRPLYASCSHCILLWYKY